MGLFSNKKKLCPICGNATPRLLPQKFDDQPICKECEKKIDLPDDKLKGMTLEEFREYLVAYEENESLRSAFHATYSHYLTLDEENGLIKLKNKDRCWAIEKKYLKSFCILEDDNVLFESGAGRLNSYSSDIPARAEALEPTVKAFQVEKREYERRMEMERTRHAPNETDEQRRERERIAEEYRPRFENPDLFREFRVEVVLEHPYWTSFEDTEQAPGFSTSFPDVDDYLERYHRQAEELHTLAVRLMHMIDPDAGEVKIGAEQTQTVSNTVGITVDAVTEIKKYKELLEQGIITEEEFTEKKRQLMGI